MSEVAQPEGRWPRWLARHGLAHLVPLLAQEGVGDDVVTQLQDADLAALGVRLGDRKRFAQALRAWEPSEGTDTQERFGADAGPQRRQLTILFCDLVDSTALCQSMSPELWRDTVLHYQRVAGEVLAAHGGSVAQYLGDGLLVYFGFPQAMEDAPTQAALAGLGIVAALSERPVVAGDRALRLRVRVGVDTGLVVVGDMGDHSRRERLALGDAPNVAARLQSMASPGEVLVSGATWQLVQSQVEGEFRGVHLLKGGRAPTEVWRVERARAIHHRYEARRWAVHTPLVGRRAELAALMQAWQQACAGQGQVVWLEGDPGMGKSRLLGELRQQSGVGDAQTWLWQTSPQQSQRAFQVAAQALRYMAGIGQSLSAQADSPALQAMQWRQCLDELGGLGAPHEAMLNSLLGLPGGTESAHALPTSAEARHAALGEALQAVLRRLCARGPVLWVLEDSHWADASTLHWLDTVGPLLRDWPVLLVLSTRPELRWRPQNVAHLHVVKLSGLNPNEVLSLVGHTLGEQALTPHWRALIASRTDGVPLFVEELARTLAETPTDDGAGGPVMAVPHSLQDLLMARLDRVAPAARLVAQAASVLGREFCVEVLEAMLVKAQATAVAGAIEAALDDLADAGLLLPAPDRAEPVGELRRWMFKHALIQDVAYDSMVRGQREALHQALLDVLLQQGNGDPAVLARHADAAQLSVQAVPWWLKASEQALQQLALGDAVSHLRAGLVSAERLPASPARDQHLLQLHAMLGTVHMLAKGWAAREVAQAYERANQLAQTADGVEEALWPQWGICVFRQVRGEVDAAVATGRRMLTVARQSGSRQAWLVTNMMHTQLCFYSGRPTEVMEHVEQVLHRYSDPADRALMALYSTDLRLVAKVHGLHARYVMGEPVDLAAACQLQEERARALQHPYSLAWTLSWGAMVWLHDDQPQALLPRLQEAQALADAHGYAYVQAMTRFALGWCRYRLSSGDAAHLGLESMREGLMAFRATGAGIVVPFFQTVLAEAMVECGELNEARDLLRAALLQIELGGERWHEAESHRVLARVLYAQNTAEPGLALEAVERAIEVARTQGAGRWLARAQATRALIMASSNPRVHPARSAPPA